jgi:nitroreductase
MSDPTHTPAPSTPTFVPPDLTTIESLLAMPLAEAMTTQRAIRRLRPDPVDPAIITRCIELGLRAPTGSNGQNWEFVIVTNQETKQRLAKQYRRAWPLYRRTLDTDAPGIDPMIKMVEQQIAGFEAIPAIVVCALRGGRVPLLPAPPIASSSFYGSIYPSVQNILLSARAIGLGASLLTLPLWSVVAARRILDMPMSVTPACLIPMGWPVGRYGPTTRRPVGDVVHLERFDRRK